MDEKVRTALFDLPLYSSQGCADADCTLPAVVRHPETGKFYCAGHALQLAESHEYHMKDIAIAVITRKQLLDEQAECDFCERPAERFCSYCQLLICFSDMHYIPRTGAACPECSEALEQEAEAQGRY